MSLEAPEEEEVYRVTASLAAATEEISGDATVAADPSELKEIRIWFVHSPSKDFGFFLERATLLKTFSWDLYQWDV